MAVDDRENPELDMLRREVLGLRKRVAELQRAAARHEDTEDISLAECEEFAPDLPRARVDPLEAVRAELGHPVMTEPFTARALWQAISAAIR